jgi:hypothetical protein
MLDEKERGGGGTADAIGGLNRATSERRVQRAMQHGGAL